MISRLHFWHNFSHMQIKVCGLLLVTLFCAVAVAESGSRSATVSFSLDFPGANPGHYEIVVGEDGHGSYSSNGQLNKDSEPTDPAPLPFTLSDKVREQIFVARTNHSKFQGASSQC